MSTISLGPTSTSGVRWPNHVNGRLLTAQDLAATRNAAVGRDGWLGRAIGPGVADGFVVTGSPGAVALQVSPGTGVCPGGTAVHLDATVVLDLTSVITQPEVLGSLFADCRPGSTSIAAPSAGSYVLTVRPSSTYEGHVPVQGSPTSTMPTPCVSRWEAEGVSFHAHLLDDFTGPTDPSLRRSALARWCSGADELADLAALGFRDPDDPRPLHHVAGLGDCDLPLAVFDWSGSELVFVDQWSVRRRPTRPSAAAAWWAVVADSRLADGEARFLQFQHHLDIVLAEQRWFLRADTAFEWLPPAGLLPIDTERASDLLFATVDQLDVEETGTAGAWGEMAERMRKMSDAGATMIAEEPAEATDTSGDGSERKGPSNLRKVMAMIAGLRRAIGVLDDRLDELERARRRGSGSGRQRAELRSQVAGSLAAAGGRGYDVDEFFSAFSVRVGVIDRESVDFAIRRSWCDEVLSTDGTTAVDVYFVVDGEEVAPYVLFTKRIGGVRWLSDRRRNLK
jgi:hypothetical protein